MNNNPLFFIKWIYIIFLKILTTNKLFLNGELAWTYKDHEAREIFFLKK